MKLAAVTVTVPPPALSPLSIAPPSPISAVLPVKVEAATATVPRPPTSPLSIAPPSNLAVLPVKVEAVTATDPPPPSPVSIAPPRLAQLLVKVEPVTVTDPVPPRPKASPLSIAPPSNLAVLPVKVLPVMVTVPALFSPPPSPVLVLFALAMVIADRATNSLAGTVSTGPLQEVVEQVSPEGALGPSPSSTGWLASRGAALMVTGAVADVPVVLTVQLPAYLDVAVLPPGVTSSIVPPGCTLASAVVRVHAFAAAEQSPVPVAVTAAYSTAGAAAAGPAPPATVLAAAAASTPRARAARARAARPGWAAARAGIVVWGGMVLPPLVGSWSGWRAGGGRAAAGPGRSGRPDGHGRGDPLGPQPGGGHRRADRIGRRGLVQPKAGFLRRDGDGAQEADRVPGAAGVCGAPGDVAGAGGVAGGVGFGQELGHAAHRRGARAAITPVNTWSLAADLPGPARRAGLAGGAQGPGELGAGGDAELAV